MSFRTTIQLFLLAIIVAIPLQAQAQNIAIVEGNRIMQESPQGKAVKQQLESEFAERDRELKARIEGFQGKESELQKNAVLLSADELQEQSDDLGKLKRELQRDLQSLNEDIASAEKKGIAKVEKLIYDVIVEIAKAKNIDLVLQQAVYASDAINLTDEVLKQLEVRFQQ